MRSDLITIISIFLLAKWTCQINSENSEINKLNKPREYYQLIGNNPNDTNITINYWNGNGTNSRDKRALGIFLQGLAQALGYNTTPVQIASLPNPNTSGTSSSGPVSIDIRSINPMNSPPPSPVPPSMPSSSSSSSSAPPRQRETLRFTGVVNFGNNSDILGHLRQYERLFHGSTMPPAMMINSSSSTPSPPSSSTTQPSPTTPSKLPPPRAPLLEPFLVPIPIPLAESLRYPKPLINIVTSTAIVPTVSQNNEKTYENKNKIENYKIESEEIHGDKNLNINMRQKNGVKILKDNKNRENEINEKNEKRPIQNDDESDEGGEKESYENKEKNSDNENLEDENSRENYEDEESGEIKDEKKREKIEEEEEEEDELKKEEVEDDESNENSDEYKEQDDTVEEKEIVNDQDNYYSNKKNVRYLPGVGSKLPIVDQKVVGKLMNSYGQSLEHDGRIDESIADYFGRYKDPNSGLYDQRRIALAEARKSPWWTEPDTKTPYEKVKEKLDENEKPQLSRRNRNNKKRKESEEDEKEIKISSSKKYRRPEKKRNESTEELLEKEKSLEINDKTQNSGSREKTEESNRAPFIIKTFDFVKNSAYYKPVQYIYPEESLEKNAQKIISSSNPDNFNDYKKKKHAKSEGEESVREKSVVVSKAGKSSKPQTEKIGKPDDWQELEERKKKNNIKNQLNSKVKTVLKKNNTRARPTPIKSNQQSKDSDEDGSISKTPTDKYVDSENAPESVNVNYEHQIAEQPLKNCNQHLEDDGAASKNQGRIKTPQQRRPESSISVEESEEFYDESGPSTTHPAEIQYDEEASEIKYNQVPQKTVYQQPLVLLQNLNNKDEKIIDQNLPNKNQEYDDKNPITQQQNNYINYQLPDYQQQDVTAYPRNVYYYENTGTRQTPYQIGSSPVQYPKNNDNKQIEYDGEIDDPQSTIGYFDIYKIKYNTGNDEEKYNSGNKFLNTQINAENRKFIVKNDPSLADIKSSKFIDEPQRDVDKETNKMHVTEKIEEKSRKLSEFT